MRKDAFRLWLSNRGNASDSVRSRLSNCKIVEKWEGNLDHQFEQDQLVGLLNRLRYSKEDKRRHRPARHKIPIDGDIYDGTATYRSVVSSYKRFRKALADQAALLAPVPSRSRTAKTSVAAKSSTFPAIDELADFFRRASFYRYHPGFQRYERDYKIRLANSIAKSRELVNSDPSQSLKILRRALTSKDNNIINWHDLNPLLAWLKTDPQNAAESLRMLWDERTNLDQRLGAFCGTLAEIGLTQSGAQLAIGSTLLMSLGVFDSPPVKMKPFSRAMDQVGWAGINTIKTMVDRYKYALAFMDAMIEHSTEFKVDLRDRLDAQAVIWCVSGGWKKVPVPSDWVNDPAQRMEEEVNDYSKELAELETEPGSNELTNTEKLALVKARRGQGKFRESLLSFWGCCALTECSELSLLRASHIKPWKVSENAERLDPYNGLLLAPNLDAAFDRGLVTFDDDGRIIVSKSLNSNDVKALGIRRDFRLRKISPQHLPYLGHHREDVFEKRTKTEAIPEQKE